MGDFISLLFSICLIHYFWTTVLRSEDRKKAKAEAQKAKDHFDSYRK
jgi:hypothetical protein